MYERDSVFRQVLRFCFFVMKIYINVAVRTCTRLVRCAHTSVKLKRGLSGRGDETKTPLDCCLVVI